MSSPAIPRDRAESLLGLHLPAFGGCFIEAEKDWDSGVETRIRINASDSWKARLYWERANFHARLTFAQVPGARLLTYGGVPMVEIDDEVWVRFKKMQGNHTTVGYPTVQRLTFASQGHLGWGASEVEQLAFAWGGPRPILVCGYVLDPMGRIGGLYMSHPAGVLQNAYDFPIPMAEATTFTLPAEEPQTPLASPLPIVRRRAE